MYYQQVLGGFNIIGNNSHAQRAPDDLLSERLPTVEVPILRFGGYWPRGFKVCGFRFRVQGHGFGCLGSTALWTPQPSPCPKQGGP